MNLTKNALKNLTKIIHYAINKKQLITQANKLIWKIWKGTEDGNATERRKRSDLHPLHHLGRCEEILPDSGYGGIGSPQFSPDNPSVENARVGRTDHETAVFLGATGDLLGVRWRICYYRLYRSMHHSHNQGRFQEFETHR